MVPAENLLAFTLAAALLIAIPGPSVLFVIGRSLALGRTGGLLSVLGNTLGVLGQIVLVAFGVGVVIAQSAVLFAVVKYVGAAYLVFLGVQAIRHRHDAVADVAAEPTLESEDEPAARAKMPGPRRSRSPVLAILTQGLVVGATNPKAIVFFAAVLPQFVDANAGSVPLQLAVLGAVFAIIALAFDSVWALAAGAARDWFARRPKRMSQLAAGGGVMMIGLGGVVALTGEPARATR